jgi:hypothetical protein
MRRRRGCYVFARGCERSVYCSGGAEKSKGDDGEEEMGGVAAAALPHAVAPVEAPSAYSFGGAEERNGFGCYDCACGGARGSAKRGGGEALRRVARL